MNETDKATETRIRGLIDDRVRAVRARDVEAAMANVAADIVSFDVVNPLLSAGAASSRKRAEQWFASFEGPIGFEITDLTIAVNGDVAFCYGLNHVNALKASGERLEMWWRATVCFQKTDGKWLITHEHNSVPFDMETGKASLALKP